MKTIFTKTIAAMIVALTTALVPQSGAQVFAAPDDFNPGANNSVGSLALQADGKIVVGGNFTTLGGQSRSSIGRLYADGAVDASFNPGADGFVSALAAQADGKILVGGDFTSLGGQSRNHLGRLNADGTLDMSFDPGADNRVTSLALQADGKILVGGYFTTLGGQSRNSIGRLNADGTVDASFHPGTDGDVDALALQADGKILVGGYFSMLGGQNRNYLGRLNADGTVDASFHPGTDSEVYALTLQADGKILVGGSFFTLGGQSRNFVGRLNANGTVDSSFHPGANNIVVALSLQADGKILVGGIFSVLGGQNRSGLGRLNADGTVDASFLPGINLVSYNAVTFLALQADGKLLVGGNFQTLGGQDHANLGRLINTGPAAQNLSFDGSSLTWVRGGTSPEVGRTTFEYSPDGHSWSSLGAGSRVPGGWQLAGLALPVNTTFRARGYAAGGACWLVESYLGSPAIYEQPDSLTNNTGGTAKFSVYAGGTAPLSYQWRANGLILVDGGNISGATTASLILSNAALGDMAGYSVVIANGFGSVTSAVATLTVVDTVIRLQPASQAWNLGDTASFNVVATGTPPLFYQWRQDGAVLAGATQSSLILTNLQGTDAGSYDVVISNAWSSTTGAAAILTVNLIVPDSFDPGADDLVSALAPQADGAILVGGYFSNLGGLSRTHIGRLNTNGTVEANFNPGTDGVVDSLALQPDGKILVGGGFSTLAGAGHSYLGRINADGTADNSFNPGANNTVNSLMRQANGKILLGGSFTMLGGQTRNYIGRLNADGTVDMSLNPGTDSTVSSLAAQPDGKILVGGWFYTMGGQSRNYIGRLNADGTLDASFNPGVDYAVTSLALQADGKILVGGYFNTLGGQRRHNLGRLNADGTLDASFNPGANAGVTSLALQTDGKILAGGYFSLLGGQSRNGIGRLNADGRVDPTFNPGINPGPNSRVTSLALQTDGKILVGGYFTTLGGQSRTNVGRLNNSSAATQNMSFDGATLVWMRGGSSPEVGRTTFEYSSDGNSWTSLGAGSRIPGGWQLAGLALPINTTFRARGYATGGGESSWFVESYLGPPVVYQQPTSVTNNAGATAQFSVRAAGSGPLTYQWRANGLNLTDGTHVSGAATASLTVSNVLHADVAGYSVVIANAAGSATSAVVTLTLIDPVINLQPASPGGNLNLGDTASFNVVATGTPPLDYQWRKDGGPLAGATQSSLTLTNLHGADAGIYDVVVSNPWGSTTSTPALLPLNLTVPDAFNPGADESVFALAPQPDAKILIGGLFKLLGGESRSSIGRLNADGTVDTSFSGGANLGYGFVLSFALQGDGKILVGGFFDTLGGQSRNNLGRLNADGTLDMSFNPGADNGVNSLSVQADGKILVGGGFSRLGGQVRNCIGRLNADGTLDASFNPGADSAVSSLSVQADGKILVGGGFTTLGGLSRKGIGRLYADGTVETSFNPGVDYRVLALALQADGKIVVGGDFSTLGGQNRKRIGRLNADGALDASFNPGADYLVSSLALQADGKILVGGGFSTLGGQSRQNLGRLNVDGTVDASFNPGTDDLVHSVVVQGGGKILVGGNFNTLGGQNRAHIGRLNNPDAATQSLTFDGAALIWIRGGASPEVWRTTFESSPDGLSWTSIGAGSRIPGGWQLGGLSLPLNTTIRARGYVASGSSWLVEAYLGAPVIYEQPANLTNNAGTTAKFGVYAGGTAPLSYQWRANGRNLVDGGNISGATTPNLTVSNLLHADSADYSVVINLGSVSVTSALATLTVIDPVISLQPTSQAANQGDMASFNVAATGTPSLYFQWRKDGAPLAGATLASLILTNLQAADRGNYDVVVSNSWGRLTSDLAHLDVSVNLALPDSFNPGMDYPASALALQADGKILLGGYFTSLGGESHQYIGRLNADGTLDTAFNPQANDYVGTMAVLPDGKILAGGYFTNLNGQGRGAVGRLNADGTLDPGFNPSINVQSQQEVAFIGLPADGKIVLGGNFNIVGGNGIVTTARFTSDGSVDASFRLGYNSWDDARALQPDGKILLGESGYSSYGYLNVHRLNTNGTIDSGFNAGVDNYLFCQVLQPDGKILVGGMFSTLSGEDRSFIGRLNADGSADPGFNPGADGAVCSMAVQTDGKILVGGWFTTLGGLKRTGIGRLNPDGTLDTSFNPGTDGDVGALALQADGKILVAGDFSELAGESRTNFGRLINTEPATQRLSFDGSTLTWSRGGTSPEVWRTTFEYSPDGSSWTSLGAGNRIAGGWQLTGLGLPTNTTFRARGYATGGFGNGSTWFVESRLQTALAISSVFHAANGQFGFNVSGPVGQVVVIEASPDVRTWVLLQTTTLGAGTFSFTDPRTPTTAQFYRLRSGP